MRSIRQYCKYGDPNCIRAWMHTDACRPGCRICHTDEHLTPNCPSWGDTLLTEEDPD